MEANSGMTLLAFMKKNAIDLRAFLNLSLEFADLLSNLHQRGLLRHNFNPEHVSITPPSGRLTFLPIQPSQSNPALEHTIAQQDELIRAYTYISPELTGRMKRKIDPRSDLYALGVLLYELLTGELPYQANTANEWIHAHMALLPVPPRVMKPDVPPVVSDLVLKLLAKKVEDRYQTAYGLRSDLHKCLDRLDAEGTIQPFPLGEADERSRFRLPEKLYGRDQDLQELLDAYERSRSGSTELVLIGGHAGTGKTALIKSFQSSIMHHTGYIIFGKFDQLQHSGPYAALMAAFRDLIRQVLAVSDEQIAEWKKRLLSALGQSGIVIAEVIAELTLIIGEQPPVEELPPEESTNRFQTLFGNFIKVFADKKHPLVIALDDLQWADPASLQLLQALIRDPSNKYLFIIGTYRKHEIHEGHFVEETLFGNLRTKGSGAHFITVEPLDYPNVTRYVADALHAEPSGIKPLAEIMYRKTAGNPFYINQMLQFIYDEKLLYFHSEQASWEWDSESIMEREIFKDVVSLIEERFHALPENTRQVLRLAGCIGNCFDIRLLSMLYEQETTHTERDLLPALNEGLVLAEQDTYTFLHDRVQQAAYNLTPDEDKMSVHLKIGRSMLRFFASEATDDHLFEVVHHLNLGSGFMADRAEKEQLARLNLQAGKKAKASAAYTRALELLNKGAQLIEDEGWSRHGALYFQLLLESAECEYFGGYFDRAETVLAQLLLDADNPVDRAKIHVIRIAMYAFRKREVEAGEIALQAMAEFGLQIPSKSSRLLILAEIANTQLRLAAKAELLMDLPASRDPMHQALANIVMASSSILFIVNEELSAIVLAQYVRLSLKQGNSEAFSIALGSYAIGLCFGVKKYNTALRLAEIAFRYAEKTDSVLLKGKMHAIKGLILQFLRPREAGGYFQKAGQLSLEGGDMVYAGYAISSQLITGSEDLRHLNHLCATYAEQAIQALDGMTLSVLYLTTQYVRLLQKGAADTKLAFNSEHFDEGKLLREPIVNKTHISHQYYYYTCKLEVYYLYGHHAEAVLMAEESENWMETVLSFNQRHVFYHALAILAAYPGASEPVRRRYRKTFTKLLARMKQWTKVVPENTMSKYKLMLAEWARLNRDHAKAVQLYDQAIQWAQKNGYPRDEAIAHELAAQHYLSLDKSKIAEAYLQDACSAYFKWGAFGKIASLQERYPVLKKLSYTEKDEPADSRDNAEPEFAAAVVDRGLDQILDMDTLRQASKMGSKDKAEADLLENFLDLAIRNAGAEKGVVLLEGEGRLVVEAYKDVNRDPEKHATQGTPYSPAVVQFVMRTQDAVVLGEACQSIFARDPYIQRNRPQSILCLPIHYPDNRAGVLYLENNLTPDAFPAYRLEILEMAFSHIAYLKRRQIPNSADEFAATSPAKPSPALVESLTDREMDILRLMAEGLSNKEIGLQLVITEGTVKNHAFNLFGKLQVKRRVQAIAKARQLQLLD